MADLKAQVTLTSLNPDHVKPAQRHLELTPDQRVIHIGRASNSTKKGFVAAHDNAWFDSPVMSRNHAEILLHPDNKTIQLQDIGSMHGTILNEEALERKQPRSINNGDVVKFGAEVRRGSDIYPACSFKVEYAFDSVEPVPVGRGVGGTTIKAPENSDPEAEANDSEDDNESESSDDEMPIITNQSRSASVEIIGSSFRSQGLAIMDDIVNTRKAFQTIGSAENPHEIDSDVDQESDEEMEENQAGDRSDSDDSSNSDPYLAAMVDSDDSESEEEEEVAEIAVDEIDHEIRRLSDNTGIEISNVRADDGLWGELSESEDVSDDIFGGAAASDDDEPEYVPKSPPVARNLAGRSLTSADIESETGEESEDCASSVGNDSTESVMGDYQSSEAEANSVEAEGYPSSDEDSEMGIPANTNEVSKYDIMKKALASENEQNADPKAAPSNPISVSSALPWAEPSNEGEATHEAPRSLQQMTSDEVLRKAALAREPSPSDAAMVKESNVSLAATDDKPSVASPMPLNANPLRSTFDVDLLSSKADNFVENMGKKTGKVDFFQAREKNRAQLAARSDSRAVGENAFIEPSKAIVNPLPSFLSLEQSQPSLAFSPYFSSTAPVGGSEQWPSARSLMAEVKEPSGFKTSSAPSKPQSAWDAQSSPAAYPQQEDRPLPSSQSPAKRGPTEMSRFRNDMRQQQLEMMNNAYFLERQQARKSAAIQTPPSLNTSPVNTTRPIDGIFSPPVENRKRKADQISVSEVEVKKSTATEPSSVVPSATGEASVPASGSSADNEEPVARAPKRMKRFVEAVGYAALGGAAVGAGLFSVLVATAPDFL